MPVAGHVHPRRTPHPSPTHTPPPRPQPQAIHIPAQLRDVFILSSRMAMDATWLMSPAIRKIFMAPSRQRWCPPSAPAAAPCAATAPPSPPRQPKYGWEGEGGWKGSTKPAAEAGKGRGEAGGGGGGRTQRARPTVVNAAEAATRQCGRQREEAVVALTAWEARAGHELAARGPGQEGGLFPPPLDSRRRLTQMWGKTVDSATCLRRSDACAASRYRTWASGTRVSSRPYNTS